MIKVKIGSKIYYYDSAADVHSDYPDAVYVGGYFIADEEERSDEQ